MGGLSYRAFAALLVGAAALLLFLAATTTTTTTTPVNAGAGTTAQETTHADATHDHNDHNDHNDHSEGPHARHAHHGGKHGRVAAGLSAHEQLLHGLLDKHEAALAAAGTAATPTAPDQLTYIYDGPLPDPAELSLRTGLREGSTVEVHGRLYGALIVEIVSMTQDVLVHVNVRPYQDRVVVNEQTGGVWGTELALQMFVRDGSDAVLALDVKKDAYKISVDGRAVAQYEHVNNPNTALTLSIRTEADRPSPGLVVNRVVVFNAPPKRVAARELLKGVEDRADTQPPLSRDRPVRLFIGVMSRPSNIINRFAVRNAWMLHPEVKSGNVAVRFFVGRDPDNTDTTALEAEIKQYNDVVISPYHEGYYEIANKTRHILEVASTEVTADFVMKCDDDTFVRIDRVLESLKSMPPDNLVFATISMGGSPIRDRTSKWYMPESEFPERSYAPFPHGPGYVLSANLAREITTSFKAHELKALRLEDVSVGMWIDRVRRKLDLAINFRNDRRFNIGSCNSGDLIGHYINPQRMVCMWRKVESDDANWCCG